MPEINDNIPENSANPEENGANKAKARKKAEKVHEPLLLMTKRADLPFFKAAGIRAVSIILSLVFCGIITVIFTGDNPFSVYGTILNGAFGSSIRIWATLKEIALLLLVSVAITPAFKMHFWNIGGEGQVLIGALATAFCMVTFGGTLPTWLLIIVMIVMSILAGTIWGVLPAFFKSRWGTNETLFTLMMNYIAIQLIEFFLKVVDKTGSNTVGPSILKEGWLPVLFDQPYLLPIIFVAVITVIIHVYLKYSKHGYEISVVGESENTARYVGINVKKVIIRTMALSGALCGFVGLLLVGGISHSIDPNLADGRGFTAIMVAWLAKFNPLVMVFASALLVIMQLGGAEVASKVGLNEAYSDILTGIILFFIIGCEFFVRYRVHFNKKNPLFRKKEKEVA